MDWQLAITRNRDQLKQIVLALFALAQMRVGSPLFTLRRDVFAAIMLVLRPAESAVRRLIVIAAHGLSPSSATSRKPGDWPIFPLAGEMSRRSEGRGGREGHKAFKLFDPLKSFDPEAIWDNDRPAYESWFGHSDPASGFTILDTTPLDATHIGQRLNAMMRALDNLPHQARRLVRWQAKRDALLKASKPTRIYPMRPGLPPGWRRRKIHEIDDVLRECHGLANDLLNAPNTS